MAPNNFLPTTPVAKFPKLETLKVDSPLRHMFVDEQFAFLKKYIQEYEKALDSEHEVGIMMTNFGQAAIMQVVEITYEKPVLLIFKEYVNGKMSTLIQHMNQLNFLLTSLDKVDEKPKQRIGFVAPKE